MWRHPFYSLGMSVYEFLMILSEWGCADIWFSILQTSLLGISPNFFKCIPALEENDFLLVVLISFLFCIVGFPFLAQAAGWQKTAGVFFAHH